jgi:hypothetical protein
MEDLLSKKRKIFFWLLLRDRLSTREILRRRNMFLEDYNCVFCASMPVEESVTHLFLHCPFAQACWATLGLIVPHMLDPFDIVVMFRNQLHCPFALEIIITMSWSIWSARNDLIF